MPFDSRTPLTTARYPASTLRYASDRRAEFFAALDRVGKCRRDGFKPIERDTLHLDLVTIQKAGKFAPLVLS